MRPKLLSLVFCLAGLTSFCQDIKPFTVEGEAKYFDFWEGTWYKIVNDKLDTTSTCFKVKKGVHAAAWMEDWKMVLDSTHTVLASAVRAWDKTNNKWMY